MNSVAENVKKFTLPVYVSKGASKDISKYIDYINLKTTNKIKILNYNVIVCGEINNSIRNEIISKIYNVLKERNLITRSPVFIYNTDKIIHRLKNKMCVIEVDGFYIRYLEDIVAELTSNNNICLLFESKDKINPQLRNVYWKCGINIDKNNYIKNLIQENGFCIAKNSKFIKYLEKQSINKIDKILVNVFTIMLQKKKKTLNDTYFKFEDIIKERSKEKKENNNFKLEYNKLDKIVGLESTKEQIKDIIAFVEMCKKRKQQIPSLHMCFMGNPRNWKNDNSENNRRII